MNGFFIGRFQPFHLGHLYALDFALSKVNNLWIGIGSSNKLDEKNPFSATERKTMILSSIDISLLRRIKIYFIPDFDDHKKWVNAINSLVPKYEVVFSNDVLTTNIYSQTIKVIPIQLKKRDMLSGTNIRNKIVSGKNWKGLVPEGTKQVLQRINANRRKPSFNYK